MNTPPSAPPADSTDDASGEDRFVATDSSLDDAETHRPKRRFRPERDNRRGPRGETARTPTAPRSERRASAVVDPEEFLVDLDDGRVDQDAAKVVRRLTKSGFEAYLVGGCVRDLLLGRNPKDFDVATSARPDDVRDIFRNSRIIGRRFRLVHVLFGGNKVIETATFRRSPEQDEERAGDDLLIRDDNAFGEAHEDARRRDFTINALFYDLEKKRVLDWVGGKHDVDRRAIHTIGDPIVRFQEDPVRILRAIKFSARLDLGITPAVYDAIVQCRGSLAMAARPRVFEELLRLMRGGAAHRSMWLAWELGVLDVLLPELSAYLADCKEGEARIVWHLLSEVDAAVAEKRVVDDCVLFAALLLAPLREACNGAKDRLEAGFEFMEPLVDRLAVPRRIADTVRRAVAVLPRVEAGKAGRFANTPLYPIAAELAELVGRAQTNARVAFATEMGAPAGPAAVVAEGGARRRRRR